MSALSHATCNRCGITNQVRTTRRRDYICGTCRPWLTNPQPPNPRDGLPPGRWVPRRGDGILIYLADQRPPCGTHAGYREHLRRGETTCGACRDAVRPNKYGPRRDLAPCGTHAAFNRHKNRGERPCFDCYEAERIYQTTRVRDRRKVTA